MNKVAILIVVECGYIEQQAILLIKSILKFYQGKNYKVEIFTFSPRENHKPSQSTLDFLSKNVSHHFTENLNTDYIEFPLINGHIGASFFEQHFPEYENIILLDTDTVFLQDFECIFNSLDKALFLSPVDNKGVGTLGESDPNHDFWLKLYDYLSIELPTQKLITTVGQEKIWPYFNAGFVFSKNINKFFSQWLKTFKLIYNSKIRSIFSGRNGSKSIYLEQVALALTAQIYKEYITMLPGTFNYPIPFHPKLSQREDAYMFSDLIHIHYHKWFQHPGFLDHITSGEDKKTEQYQWLKKHLPLYPLIEGPFKC